MHINHHFISYAWLGLILFPLLFSSCSSEDEARQAQIQQQLEQMRAAKEQDERLLNELIGELDGINSYIDSLDLLTGSEDIDRLDALDKIQLLDSLVEAKNKTVDSLSAQIDRNDPLLRRELNRYRQQANAYQEDLNNLSARLEESEQERVSLQETVREQLATIRQKNQQLSSLEDEKKRILIEVEDARTEQQKLLEENKILENERKQQQEVVAQDYYQSGKELYGVAEKMSKLLNRKKKEELTVQAYELLLEASKRGNLSARRLAFDIKEKYPKYFE